MEQVADRVEEMWTLPGWRRLFVSQRKRFLQWLVPAAYEGMVPVDPVTSVVHHALVTQVLPAVQAERVGLNIPALNMYVKQWYCDQPTWR